MIAFNRLNNYLKMNTGRAIEKEYDQTIYAFDVEDSNGYIIDGVARPFDYTKDPSYYADKEKVSLLYLWQFAVDDVVFYGRTLDEFKPALEYLARRPYKSIIFVHNLAHEFMFLLNIIKWDSVFARKAHRPMKCTYGNVEFRCTYMLTRQSLAAVAKSVGLEKYKDFDYDEIKTPLTPLTSSEMRYGGRDVEIIVKLIERLKSENTRLQDIPLTQTGRPRKEVKKIYARDMGYHYKMQSLFPRDVAEYARLRAAFVGGWVHANYYYNNITLKDCVYAYDITSSYPLQMVLRKYPQTAWTQARKGTFGTFLDNDNFCCLIKLAIANCHTRGYNDYLSVSKIFDSESSNVKSENGRIYKADRITLLCTSVDYDILRECYEGEFEVLDLWYARAGYLDIRYVNYILELYENKVKLTGDPEKKELRARSKEILNSLYGMMVSALVYDDVIFDGDDWQPPETDPARIAARVQGELDKQRAKPYKIFTSYSYGVFVTAWARYSLWQVIREVGKNVVYHDTDSVYCVGANRDIIDRYNEDMKKQLLELCEARGIPHEKVHPKDLAGVENWLGVYTCDNDEIDGAPFAEFRTLGAKRYCYRKTRDDDIKITVAGVSKISGAAALENDINNFKDGLIFDYAECNKLLPHYNTAQPVTKWIDRDGNEYTSHDKYGITLQPARYILNRGQYFIDVLAALGSLSNQFSEMSIDDLQKIAGV